MNDDTDERRADAGAVPEPEDLDAGDAGPGALRPVRQVEIPLSSLIVLGLIVVGVILLLRAVDRTQLLIGLALLAGILTAIVGPAVAAVQRVVGHTASAILVHLAVFVLLAAGTGLVLQQIRVEADALAAFTEVQIDETDGETGEVLQQSRFDERLGEAAADWGTRSIVGNDDAGSIATRVSQLTVVIVLSIFFTLQGGSVVNAAMSWTSDRARRRRWRERWSTGSAAASTYVRRSALIALISGLSAAALAAAFDLPAIVLIGVWAALLSVVPLLGTVVGWMPIVLLAVIETSTPTAILVAALAIVGVVGVNVARSRFVRVGVRPGSFLIAMSIACGLTAAGIPGALAAVFATVAIVTIMTRPHESDDAAAVHEDPDAMPVTSVTLEELTDRRDPRPGAERSGPAPLLLTLSRRTAVQITLFVILAFLVQRAITSVGPIIVWAVVGALIAIGLDRPVAWVERHVQVGRPVIVVVAAIVVVCAVAGLVSTATGSFGGARPMDEGIPEFVETLTDLPLVGESFADADLEARIEQFQRDIPNIVTQSPVAGQAFGLLGGGLVGAFWVVLAALTCLLDGPRLVGAIDRRVPARISRQTTRLARAGKVALGGYVAGAAVVAAMNGGIVLVLGIVFGVPMVAVLALWAFSWNFIPQVGAIIGWAPLLLLALLASPVRGIACLVIFIVYQVIENNAIQPTIVGNAVDIGALAALGAALAGAALAGLIGAALAIPVAGVARALYRESHREDFPPIRSRREATADARVLP